MAADWKRCVKDVLAEADYACYRAGLKKCPIQVQTIGETIEELLRSDKSLVRYGDGEMTMIRGRSLAFQEVSPELAEGLKRILQERHEGLMMAIPDIFGDLGMYRKETSRFWKDHLLFARKYYMQYCDRKRIYGNAYLSRFYHAMEDKGACGGWIAKIKQLWQDRDVVVVEGERTHNGVGNDLLAGARSVARIIGPSEQAYASVDEIMERCREYPKNRLFLISLGIAAKFLVRRLYLEGCRALDIGHLDMEYEWYLRGAQAKEKIPKHEIVGEEANWNAGYHAYLSQIQHRVV